MARNNKSNGSDAASKSDNAHDLDKVADGAVDELIGFVRKYKGMDEKEIIRSAAKKLAKYGGENPDVEPRFINGMTYLANMHPMDKISDKVHISDAIRAIKFERQFIEYELCKWLGDIDISKYISLRENALCFNLVTLSHDLHELFVSLGADDNDAESIEEKRMIVLASFEKHKKMWDNATIAEIERTFGELCNNVSLRVVCSEYFVEPRDMIAFLTKGVTYTNDEKDDIYETHREDLLGDMCRLLYKPDRRIDAVEVMRFLHKAFMEHYRKELAADFQREYGEPLFKD